MELENIDTSTTAGEAKAKVMQLAAEGRLELAWTAQDLPSMHPPTRYSITWPDADLAGRDE